MANTITKLITWLTGKQIGQDLLGNRYYQDKKEQALHGRPRRWVIYKEADQAADIPPLCHAWLHHTANDFPSLEEQTIDTYPLSYKPRSSIAQATGDRPKASGDYEAWRP